MYRLRHPVQKTDVPYTENKCIVLIAETLILVSMMVLGSNASGDVYHNNTSSQYSETTLLNSDMLLPVTEVNQKYIILDVGENPDSYIRGAIHIPYTYFLDDSNSLRPIQDLAKILGYMGLSRNDSIAVYGKCLVCGGGPSTATFTYWLLRYLGQDDVKVIDGGLASWIAAGLPVQEKPSSRPKAIYTPNPRWVLLANYSYVKNGNAQIVDARPANEFEAGSIPRAINIPYDDILNGELIKDKAGLEKAFGNLTKDKPVVVFTATGVKASVVWFALTAMGYDAMLYNYQDWLEFKKIEDSNVTATSPKNNTNR